MRVLLADDHAIFRKGLREILDKESDMTVVGEAQDGVEAVSKAEELAPDVILMDLKMPRLDGIGATRLITERDPEARIIILTMYLEEEYVSEASKAGVRGYILKGADLETMLEAIRAVHRGEVRIDPAMASKVLVKLCQEAEDTQERIISLTEREKEILSFVVKGDTNSQIAQRLLLSERTVDNHISAILRKLGVRNRTQAAVYAVRGGLLIPT
ncbi:MAG: response regulator transcription factor [Chloroflexi bacterium]|nr:response regulator transcription factor [Chloroflexota bacterium]